MQLDHCLEVGGGTKDSKQNRAKVVAVGKVYAGCKGARIRWIL